MKDRYTLELSHHQAKILVGLMTFANQFFALAPNQPLYNIPQDVLSDLVKTDASLLRDEVVKQLKAQDAA